MIDVTGFSAHADSACAALVSRDSARFVGAMCGYADELERQALVHPDTGAILQRLDALPGVLARKGCGALGADVRRRDRPRRTRRRAIAATIAREFAAPVGRAEPFRWTHDSLEKIAGRRHERTGDASAPKRSDLPISR